MLLKGMSVGGRRRRGAERLYFPSNKNNQNPVKTLKSIKGFLIYAIILSVA